MEKVGKKMEKLEADLLKLLGTGGYIKLNIKGTLMQFKNLRIYPSSYKNVTLKISYS